jgi:AraC-like DNA-binding protein
MTPAARAALDALGVQLLQHRIAAGAPHFSMVDAVGQHIAPHRLRILRRLIAHVDLRSAGFGSIQITYTRFDSDVVIEPERIENCFLFDIPLAGCSWIRDHRSEAPITPGMTGITTPGHAVTYLQECDCELVTLRVGRAALERELSLLIGAWLPRPLEFGLSATLECGGGRALLGGLGTVCQQLADGDSPLARGCVTVPTERWLLATLLHGLPHNYSDTLHHANAAPSLPHYLARVEKFIESRLPNRFDLDELIAASGMSRRTLFAGYRRYFGASPMNHIRNRRLAEVRAALLAADPCTTSVTEIALKWGFGNLGNFAAAYRRKYGEAPSATLRRVAV